MDQSAQREEHLATSPDETVAEGTRPARRFRLIRHTDVTGVSGTGPVADGVQWADGTVALHWSGCQPATSVWQKGIDAVIAVHGHDGGSTIHWLDEPSSSHLRAD